MRVRNRRRNRFRPPPLPALHLLAVAGSGKLGLKLAPCLSVIGKVGDRRRVLGEPVKGAQPAQRGLPVLERHHIGPVRRRAISGRPTRAYGLIVDGSDSRSESTSFGTHNSAARVNWRSVVEYRPTAVRRSPHASTER